MPSTPRRSVAYGQNFLHDRRLVERLVARSSIAGGDLVVEIGPGTGIITERLAGACRQVLAVEKDPLLARRLRERLAQVGAANVALFEGDALAFPLPVSAYKVFASIPFNATAAIVARLTAEPTAPLDAYLVLQREAAARFLGAPRGTLAAALLHPWFEPTIVHRFQRSDFLPAPRVDVVLLRLRKRGPPLVAPDEGERFRDLVAWLYTAWRPTVREALAAAAGREVARRIERAAGIDLARPPASLASEEWLPLVAAAGAAETRLAAAVAGAHRRLRARESDLAKLNRTRTHAHPAAARAPGRARGRAPVVAGQAAADRR